MTKGKTELVDIREVWADNLETEFRLIREIVDDYTFVAMDTEFPGVVLYPLGKYGNSSDRQYAELKANVELLKLIQLGLTFSDERGNLPRCGTDGRQCIWQFNFRDFDYKNGGDGYVTNSLHLLKDSGIDFNKCVQSGIKAENFAELLMSSGAILNDEIQWITFHGVFDFAYLLKILSMRKLPITKEKFVSTLKIFFPVFCDIKNICLRCDNLYGGLARIAAILDVPREGRSHQAGSDSLLTSRVYHRLFETLLSNDDPKRFSGELYRLSEDHMNNHWDEFNLKIYE